MGKINIGRVIAGGLLAGLVINIGETVLNTVVIAGQMEAAVAARNLPPVGGREIASFVIMCFGLGIATVWLYAAIRTRFGPGVPTAVLNGAVVWFLAYLWPGMGDAVMQIFPIERDHGRRDLGSGGNRLGIHCRRLAVPRMIYADDLAYVHHAGFGDYARRAAPEVDAPARPAVAVLANAARPFAGCRIRMRRRNDRRVSRGSRFQGARRRPVAGDGEAGAQDGARRAISTGDARDHSPSALRRHPCARRSRQLPRRAARRSWSARPAAVPILCAGGAGPGTGRAPALRFHGICQAPHRTTR